MIIRLTGKKGCGKTSAAISMRDHHGYIVRSLATPLKDTLVKFGVPVENMETPGLKETPLEQFGNKSAREVMQLFGTDFARAMISNTIWVDKLRQDIQTLIDSGIEDIVVDDIRFNNEARAIKELCGVIVEVSRPDVFDGDSHISERGVSSEFIDGRLENVSSYSSDLDFRVTNMLGGLQNV